MFFANATYSSLRPNAITRFAIVKKRRASHLKDTRRNSINFAFRTPHSAFRIHFAFCTLHSALHRRRSTFLCP